MMVSKDSLFDREIVLHCLNKGLNTTKNLNVKMVRADLLVKLTGERTSHFE